MPSGTARERFVILCLGRTGSSHLVDLLDSHPHIRCWAEILNETHPKAAPEGWIGDADTDDAGTHAEALFASAGPDIAATGFKLPQNSLTDHPEAAGWLRATPELIVIRLRRRNTLALLVSRRMVRATLVSQSIQGSYGETQVRLEPQGCVRALERIEAEDAELDEMAAGHRILDIDYDELGSEAAVGGLLDGLGVERLPLDSRYERLRTRSFAETIENWEEVEAALRGTRFEPLLSDDG